MPSIHRNNIASGTANALAGLKFEEIGPNGANVTLYASTPTAGAQVSFSAEGGERELLSLGNPNIEISADVVQADGVDMLLADEPVGPGKMFLQIDSQIVNFRLFIEEE